MLLPLTATGPATADAAPDPGSDTSMTGETVAVGRASTAAVTTGAASITARLRQATT